MKWNLRCRLSVAVLLMTLLCVLGCSRHRPSTYPVTGEVRFADGTPVTDGVVEFESVGPEPRLNARGTIERDGAFRLGTFSANDGAIEGEHRAVVVGPVVLGDKPPSSTPVIPANLARYDSSGLQFTVSRDPAKNHFTIRIPRAAF